MQSIHEFIAGEMGKPFVWDDTSCAAMADRRVRQVTGISPLEIYGRPIGDEKSAREWLARPGGLILAVGRVMRSAGFVRTYEPRCDDVGLIYCNGRVCVALFDGATWFSRDEDGFIGAPLEAMIMAWRIECRS